MPLPEGHEAFPPGCPYGNIELAEQVDAMRALSPALHCALLSDCADRAECLERVSDLAETARAARGDLSAEDC